MQEYVLGHKSPDTDSYCSAVVYARYLGATPVALGEPTTEIKFVFDQLGVAYPEVVSELPAGSKIHLVDHNEPKQSIDHREHYEIASVIDHHKFGDFSTSGPLMMRVEPVGCTCTILYEMFVQSGYTLSETDARLMISAIISDTLYFRSPTTRQRDRDALEGLQQIAQLPDLEAYASQMFEAKSDLSGLTAIEIVKMDAKQFEFGGIKIGIGVMETTNPQVALTMKESLLEAIAETKQERGVQCMLFCVIDILEEHNTTFVIDQEEQELLQNVFDVQTHDQIADMGNRISRKKQLAKPLAEYFEK